MPCRFIARETVTALMHEQLRPYGWGGPLEPHAVGPVRLRCPAATRYTETGGIKACSALPLVIISCVFRRFLHFISNGALSLAGGCSSSVLNNLYLEWIGWNRFSEPFEPYGYAKTRSVSIVPLIRSSQTACLSAPLVSAQRASGYCPKRAVRQERP